MYLLKNKIEIEKNKIKLFFLFWKKWINVKMFKQLVFFVQQIGLFKRNKQINRRIKNKYDVLVLHVENYCYEHRNWETHKQEEEGVFLLLELTDLTLTFRIWQSAMQNTLGAFQKSTDGLFLTGQGFFSLFFVLSFGLYSFFFFFFFFKYFFTSFDLHFILKTLYPSDKKNLQTFF